MRLFRHARYVTLIRLIDLAYITNTRDIALFRIKKTANVLFFALFNQFRVHTHWLRLICLVFGNNSSVQCFFLIICASCLFN